MRPISWDIFTLSMCKNSDICLFQNPALQVCVLNPRAELPELSELVPPVIANLKFYLGILPQTLFLVDPLQVLDCVRRAEALPERCADGAGGAVHTKPGRAAFTPRVPWSY